MKAYRLNLIQTSWYRYNRDFTRIYNKVNKSVKNISHNAFYF